jgi:hypothetical protein
VANPNWSLGRNLEILPKMLTFWAAIHRKTEEIHTKLRKIADSQFEIGPQKFLFGPHAARGPQVGHPCFIWKIKKLLISLNSKGIFDHTTLK